MWHEIPDFPGYEASGEGQVRSRGRVLRPWLTNGYEYVGLRRDGQTYKKSVHSLVAAAFIGPRPDGMDVCHANGDKRDNCWQNLRYDTRSANILDQVRHGRHNHSRVTKCPSGHEYTPENTYLVGNGRRQCKRCTKARAAARYATQKEIA